MKQLIDILLLLVVDIIVERNGHQLRLDYVSCSSAVPLLHA